MLCLLPFWVSFVFPDPATVATSGTTIVYHQQNRNPCQPHICQHLFGRHGLCGATRAFPARRSPCLCPSSPTGRRISWPRPLKPSAPACATTRIRRTAPGLEWGVPASLGGAGSPPSLGLDLSTLTFREIKGVSTKPPKVIYIFLQGGQQQPSSWVAFKGRPNAIQPFWGVPAFRDKPIRTLKIGGLLLSLTTPKRLPLLVGVAPFRCPLSGYDGLKRRYSPWRV